MRSYLNNNSFISYYIHYSMAVETKQELSSSRTRQISPDLQRGGQISARAQTWKLQTAHDNSPNTDSPHRLGTFFGTRLCKISFDTCWDHLLWSKCREGADKGSFSCWCHCCSISSRARQDCITITSHLQPSHSPNTLTKSLCWNLHFRHTNESNHSFTKPHSQSLLREKCSKRDGLLGQPRSEFAGSEILKSECRWLLEWAVMGGGYRSEARSFEVEGSLA